MNGKLKYGLIAIVLGIVFFFIAGLDAISFLKSPIHVNVDNVMDLKNGDHAIIDVNMTIGCSVSVITTETKNGKTTNKGESNRYYFIPLFDNALTHVSAINVYVNKDLFSKMEKAEDAFWESEVFPDETIVSVEGIVKKIGSEESSYIDSFLKEVDQYFPGYFTSSNVSDFYIKQMSKTTSLIIGGLSILAIIIGVLLFVFGLKQGAAQKANRQALVNANYYTAPQNVTFNNDPNAPAQPQAPPQGFDPYGVANDPRFANLQHNAANSQAPTNVTFNNAPAQAQAAVNNAAQQVTTIPNEVPAVPDPVEVSPITPLSPIAPMDNNGNQNNT